MVAARATPPATTSKANIAATIKTTLRLIDAPLDRGTISPPFMTRASYSGAAPCVSPK
jgi:hypothetical protein